MNCYYCGTPIRKATIICPVCNKKQNQSAKEKLGESFKEYLFKKKNQNRF